MPNNTDCATNDLDLEPYVKQRASDFSAKELEQIKQSLPDSKIYQYLWHKSQILNDTIPQSTQKIFVECYRKIAAEHWPNIATVDDFWSLPDHIQKECIDVHNFSPTIWFDPNCDFHSWQPTSTDWNFRPEDLVKYQHIVLDNRHAIKGKKVLDLACGNGHIALAIAHCDPESLTVTDVRPGSLAMAKEILQMVLPNNHSVLHMDFHDYESNTKLCALHDTVFLCGSMYHVNDHYAILESIANGGPKTVIIEGRQVASIVESKDPLIYFATESTELPYNGWQKHKIEMVVGYPNLAWFDLAMENLGYRRTKPTNLDIRRPVHMQDKAKWSEFYNPEENFWGVQVYERT